MAAAPASVPALQTLGAQAVAATVADAVEVRHIRYIRDVTVIRTEQLECGPDQPLRLQVVENNIEHFCCLTLADRSFGAEQEHTMSSTRQHHVDLQ